MRQQLVNAAVEMRRHAVFFLIAARCYDHNVHEVEGIRLDSLPTLAA